MIRVYPGETPGTCTIYVTTSHVGPILTEEDRAEADSSMEAICRVLCGEDFPAAEGCQLGVEHALDHVIVGRSEPLVQHLHRAWDRAIGGHEDTLDSLMASSDSMARSAL